jgi:HlyD family secretion protein
MPRIGQLNARFLALGRKGRLVSLAIVAGVVLLSAGGVGFVMPSANVATMPTAAGSEASRHQPAQVAGLGRIAPASEVIELGSSLADRINRWVIEEGAQVKADQVLGYLDAYAERLAESEMIAAKLAEARQLVTAETGYYEAQIQEAEIRLAETRELQPLRVAAQESRVRALAIELKNNTAILEEQEELLKRDARSRRAVDNQRALVGKTEQDLAASRALLSELRSSLRFTVEKTNGEIARYRALLARAVGAAGVGALEKQLQLAKAALMRATIRAPIDGQILKILIWPGEQTAQKAVLRMGDTAHMHAVAEIYETQISHVKLGHRARVTSPALSAPLTGKVVRIGNLIFKKDVLDIDPAADADARVVEVRIELDDSAPVQRLSNLTVDVVIQVDGVDMAGASSNVR